MKSTYTVTDSQKADQGGKSPRLASGYMGHNKITFEAGEEVVMLPCVQHQYYMHYHVWSCQTFGLNGNPGVKKVDSVGVCDEQLTQGTVGIKTVALDNSVLR